MHRFNPRPENLRMLGVRLKTLRTEKGYSIRGMARAANIAHSMISEIENGHVSPHHETLVDLYGQLGIRLITDSDTLAELKARISSFYEALYLMDFDLLGHVYADIVSDASRYEHSLLAVDYEMVVAIHRIVVAKTFDDHLLNQLTEHYTYLTPTQKQRYNVLAGTLEQNSHNYDTAIDYYARNLNLSGDRKCLAVSLACLADIYGRQHAPHKAIHFGTMASRALAEHAMLKRKMTTDLLIARNLVHIERYAEAEEIVRNLEISKGDNRSFDDIDTQIAYVKAYSMFRRGRFEEALEAMQTINAVSPYHHYYLANIYEHMGKKEEALASMKEAVEKRPGADDVEANVNRLYYLYLQARFDAAFERILKILMASKHLFPERNMFKRITFMGIEHYEQLRKPKEALSLAKAFIQSE